MLSDRSYMRGDSARTPPSVLAWFLGLLVGGFVVQGILTTWFSSPAAIEYGALSGSGIRRGFAWTLLTYIFLHGGIFHLLFNCLGAFFIGRELQPTICRDRMIKLLVTGGLGSAFLWLAVNFSRPGNVIGASGVVMALLAVFACLYPWRRMTIHLFFFIPVTIQPVWLVSILGGIDLLGLLFYEIPSNGSIYGIAHSAHLGGLAAGWLFYKFVVARGSSGSGTVIEPPAWFRRKNTRASVSSRVNIDPRIASAASPSASSASTARRDALRTEVDRILDKINLHGFGSLTAAEKRVLDEARDHLNPR